MVESSWRVLLVSDDDKDHIQIRSLLDSAAEGKSTLEWVVDFQAGWQKLAEENYDVVLVDCEKDTEGAIRFIQQAGQNGYQPIPFILVTGKGSYELDLRAMQAGAVDYLNKSELVPALLERSIRYAIDRKRVSSALAEANAALQQERSRLRTVIDHAPTGIILTDKEGNFLVVNPTAEKIFKGGLTGDASGPQGKYELLHTDGRPFCTDELPLMRSLKQNIHDRNVEIVVRHEDGSEIFLLTNTSPIYGPDNELTGSMAVMTDITEQRNTIQALRESEERFKLATRAVNAVVYDWDLKTNMIFRSDGLQQVIGIRPGDITQEHGWWEQRVHPDDYPILEKTVQERINGTANAYEIEYRVQHIQGHWIDVWERAFIIRDEHGKATRVVGTRTDITDRKRAERNSRFLADLGEQLMSLEETDQLFAYAGQAIVDHFGVDRCIFDEVDQKSQKIKILFDHRYRFPAITGTYPFSAFHHALSKRMIKGHAIIIRDTSVDPDTRPFFEGSFKRYGFRSFVAIPRMGEEGWIATLTVSSERVREWREDEIALLKQASDLVWLAVQNTRLLRKLKETQERFEVALKNTQMTVYTTDRERRYTWIYNSILVSDENPLVGKRDDEVMDPVEFKELIADKQAVLDNGTGIRKEYHFTINGRNTFVDMTIEPLRSLDGEVEGLIVAALDTTRVHEIEAQAREAAVHLALQRQINRQREEERQQIARDLHDGPIQNLLGLLFSVQMAMSITQDPEVGSELQGIQDETSKLIGELRAICNELRPPALAQFGLAKALVSHADVFREKHPDLRIQLEIEDTNEVPEDSISLALYRIFQETLNNIARHAHATEVDVRLMTLQNELVLEIQDNGQGFKIPRDFMNLAREGHLGLVGMRERAEAVGAILSMSSSPGRGTRVTIRVPKIEMAVENY